MDMQSSLSVTESEERFFKRVGAKKCATRNSKTPARYEKKGNRNPERSKDFIFTQFTDW
jgi:hypothetical protein